MGKGVPFRAGEPVILIDDRERKYLLHLRPEGSFQYHHGNLDHRQIIGSPEGCTLFSSRGAPLIALRPRQADYILKMRRGPQVVYPKDLGPMLVYADIHPGLKVLEAGTGSGALTMALARAVGPEGQVISYDVRSDHAQTARKAIIKFFGEVPEWLELREGDVTEAIGEMGVDRLVLDIAEPWKVIPHTVPGLRPGAVACFYVPTVPQLSLIHTELENTGGYIDVETFEVLIRTWNIKGRSVRPDHGMVGHTGFITVARRFQPDAQPIGAPPDQVPSREVQPEVPTDE